MSNHLCQLQLTFLWIFNNKKNLIILEHKSYKKILEQKCLQKYLDTTCGVGTSIIFFFSGKHINNCCV